MPTLRVRTIDIDLGWKQIKRNLMSLNNTSVSNGFPSGGKTSGRYSMEELASVAFENEFGTSTTPKRSFLRSSFDSNLQSTKEAIRKNIILLEKNVIGANSVLTNLGKFSVRQIKQKIRFGRFKKLSPITVRKKGHDVPLLETGQMFNSVQFKIKSFGR